SFSCCVVLCSSATFPWIVARHLFDGRVDTVEEVGRGDPKDQGCESLFVIVQSGLVPDLFWHWIRPVAEPCNRFGKRQRGAFGLGKIGRFAPGSYRKQAIVCFARLLKLPRTH